MTESVPAALRQVYDEITTITDAFCAEHLDEEYARLCRRMAAKLARKRPSPLARGQRLIWASGILYAIGQVNFLADPSQRPHLRTDDMAAALGVKQQTMGNKGRLILDTLRIGQFDPAWTRQELIEHNPLAWMIQVDGLLMDARKLPREIQVEAFELGLIPYVPA